jgi:hypothetical protein
MVELYLHSSIPHDVVVNEISTGIKLSLQWTLMLHFFSSIILSWDLPVLLNYSLLFLTCSLHSLKILKAQHPSVKLKLSIALISGACFVGFEASTV